ncbi:MAG: aminotransferase class V-fold PLP-dependent enzyme, partial [Planctomycetota bacterium]
VPASVPLAGLFDAIGSVTNQVMAIYEMGPWATAVEAALVREMAARIGFESAAGLITHGGSLANLTALLTARNVALRDVWRSGLARGDAATAGAAPVLVVHGDAHYSIARAAGVLGLGTASIVRVPLDARRRMRPDALEVCLQQQREAGRPVVAVCACACATPIGAFDPLVEIAEVCRRHGVWLHVDAAHGGGAVFSRRHRHLLDGLSQADSVVCDAHKMLFVPALCAFVFYRNAEHRFAAFEQDAPYLFDPSAPGLAEYDSALKTVECTKRAAAFGLWGLWSLFGPDLFEQLVDTTFALGRSLYERLCAADDFEPLHEPQCNIVAFRWLPRALATAPAAEINRIQREIRHRLIRSGRFYVVQTELDGLAALRVTLINPLTTGDDLDALLEAIRETGQELIAPG